MDFVLKQRKKIDVLDRRIIFLVRKRLKIARNIQAYKVKKGMKREDREREGEIIARFNKSGLRTGFIRSFFKTIFMEVKR